MEAFVWTLAAAAVVSLAGLSIRLPFLYVRLATAIWAALGGISLFGLGVIVGGNTRLGLWIFLAGPAGMLYLYCLGHLAAMTLNAKADEQTKPGSKGSSEGRDFEP